MSENCEMSEISKPEIDAFDQWWEWATKDRAADPRTIPAEIHDDGTGDCGDADSR